MVPATNEAGMSGWVSGARPFPHGAVAPGGTSRVENGSTSTRRIRERIVGEFQRVDVRRNRLDL
jgi:hypothetical protein